MLGYAWLLLEGAIVTLTAAVLGAACGLVGGMALLAAQQVRNRYLTFACRTYISFVRGTPALVQILLVYYAFPALIGLDLPPFLAGIIAIGGNSSAFMAEILRGSLSRIDKGQAEAARALGLGPVLTWTLVIVPQLLMRAIPPVTSEFTMVVKGTALLSVITVVELTRRGTQIMTETYRPVETLLSVALIYFLICFAVTALSRRYEARVEGMLKAPAR